MNFGVGASELEAVRLALVARGVKLSKYATEYDIKKAFAQWAQANGFTPAVYGEHWGDMAEQALMGWATLAPPTAAATLGPLVPQILPRAAPRMRGFGETAGSANEWADPYQGVTSSPPLVAVTPSTSSDTSQSVGQIVGGLAKGLVDIFGRQVTPPAYTVPPPAPTPLWVYALLGVGGVVALGMLARSMKSPRRAVAGYRKRKHRR